MTSENWHDYIIELGSGEFEIVELHEAPNGRIARVRVHPGPEVNFELLGKVNTERFESVLTEKDLPRWAWEAIKKQSGTS